MPVHPPECRAPAPRWPGLPLFLIGLTLLVACRKAPAPGSEGGDPKAFAELMNVGKNYYDRGDALRALGPFRKAVELSANSAEAHLNLANASLLATQATNSPVLLTNALSHALRAAEIDHHLAAAHYVAGCAHLRLRQFEPAVKEFQIARDLEPKVGATTFQLARAHQELGHWEDAITLYQELTTFEPGHRAAWYGLSQALIRAGRQPEATAALEKLQAIAADQPGTMDMTRLERCVHTEARAPFILELPDPKGIAVTFTDTTATVLPNAATFGSPVAFIDCNNDGRNSLFVGEGQGFRLLLNSNGAFTPHDLPVPGTAPAAPARQPRRAYVADIQNDRYQDVIVVGDNGSRALRFATNGQCYDVSSFSRLADIQANDAVLLDLDFTGKLDLVAVNASNQTLRVMRNVNNFYFRDITATSGIPATATAITRLAVEDWNNDDTLDLIAARHQQPPLLFLKPRGGFLTLTNTPADWPAGDLIAVGDFNNDLRGDLWIATSNQIECVLNGMPDRPRIPVPAAGIRELFPLDYDNDGWLDLFVVGQGVRVFRNLGQGQFKETTADLRLQNLAQAQVENIAAADIDNDCDTDLVLSLAGQGLRVLRNDGGSANLQLKVRLLGNRSNANGLGTRVEVHAGGLRLGRRINRLPIEIGVAQHRQLESVNARWLNLDIPTVDVQIDGCTPLPLQELTLPEGSCPYLYAWDGERFRFVTDLLGAAPLGLRISEHRFVDGDADELVWLGDSSQLQPLNGQYVFQITEELREVLYLDNAELVSVDHPPGTEVYTTGKMMPGPPFPPHEILTLHQPRALLHAARSDGTDLTAALHTVDSQMAGPVALRIPQLRGLAEPWHLTLDFGPLPVERPLVLGITGWLRFGGGMANVAASHDPTLPFPFPTLEVETSPDRWQPVDVTFGVPCGKTKSFVVDLTGKLPAGSRRLRIHTAYELYWDRIALLEKAGETGTRLTRLTPDSADLHYRGFCEFEDLPPSQPLTPDYTRPQPNPAWRITPAGWCTRYGNVLELVAHRDNALALLNGGDELTLAFNADRLPAPNPASQRTFFFSSSGWDKDSDFHCEKGWLVEPLPWHGMQDQLYGREPRPPLPAADALMQRYNTRWVGLWVPRRIASSR